MVLSKHVKLFRRVLGTLRRPRSGLKNRLVKLGKFSYLILSWAVELVGDLVFWRNRNPSPAIIDPKKILIVKVDELGDVLFSTLLLPAIRDKYPQAEIDYLVRPGAEPVLQNNPRITCLYHWNNVALDFLHGRGNRKNLPSKIRENRAVVRQLRSRNYDYVINARAYAPSANLPLHRMGKRLIAFDISEHSFLADYWADYSLDEEEVRNYSQLLLPLGIEPTSVQHASEFYCIDANCPMEPGSHYAVISPVSFEVDRQWKADCWREMIGRLTSEGCVVAMTGLPSHRVVLESFIPERLRASPDVRVFTDLPLPKFAALVKGASCFAGIDSFPAHLAIALKCRAALLVNTSVYFLKGYSEHRFAIEARSMLPNAAEAAFFDIRFAQPEEVALFCLGRSENPESAHCTKVEPRDAY